MTAFSHGKKSSFKLDNSGGALTDVTTYLTDVSMPQSVDTAEASTLGMNSKAHVVGLEGGTVSISGLFDPTIDAHLTGIKGQDATVSFEYGPQGTTTGLRKYTGEMILTAYDPSGSISGVSKFTASFITSGDITPGTFA